MIGTGIVVFRVEGDGAEGMAEEMVRAQGVMEDAGFDLIAPIDPDYDEALMFAAQIAKGVPKLGSGDIAPEQLPDWLSDEPPVDEG